MFSWIDYFDDKIVKNDDSKDQTKILEKGDFCKLTQKPMFSNKTSIRNHNCKPKTDSGKLLNNQSTRLCHKPNGKILDLSLEEKAKIAKLIKELGQLQFAKEEILNKSANERNQFELKIQSIEEICNITLREKQKLEDELRMKEEKLIELENKIKSNESNNRSISLETNDEFILVPQQSYNIHDDELYNYKGSHNCIFPGPPKSSRSQEIKHELLKSHSSTNSEITRLENHKQLSDEHERLMIEKQYLGVVLKQQKCLNHLKGKIKKLEKRSFREITPSLVESQTDNDKSINQHSLTELITPNILNDVSDNISVTSRSFSVQSKTESFSDIHSIELNLDDHLKDEKKAPQNTVSSEPNPVILKEDMMIITTLNKDKVASLKPNGLLSQRIHSNPLSIRSQSPTDSLLEIISNIDDLNSDKCDLSNIEESSPGNLSENEIFDDLFFNRLFY